VALKNIITKRKELGLIIKNEGIKRCGTVLVTIMMENSIQVCENPPDNNDKRIDLMTLDQA